MAGFLSALGLGAAVLVGSWALLAVSDALAGRRGSDRLADRFLERTLLGADDPPATTHGDREVTIRDDDRPPV